MSLVRIGDVSDIRDGSRIELNVEGKEVIVSKVEGGRSTLSMGDAHMQGARSPTAKQMAMTSYVQCMEQGSIYELERALLSLQLATLGPMMLSLRATKCSLI